MLRYIGTRLLLMIPTLIGISVLVFLVIRFAPGRPTSVGGSGPQEAVDPAIREARERILGLDKPLPVQYFNYVSRLVRLDLGRSITEHRPIRDLIGERIGLTIKINLASFLIVYLVSIPAGLVAAKNRFAGPTRRFVFDTSSGIVLLALYSIPAVLLGTLLQLVFSEGGLVDQWVKDGHAQFAWMVLPIVGVHSPGSNALTLWPYLADVLRHAILPVATLSLPGLAFLSKLSRNSLLENLRQDYVRTARAKGLRENVVVYGHALSNSLLALITILAGILPALIGGTVIVETIFGLPGMGKLYFDAVMQRDYPMIMGLSMITAVLTLTAILLTDLLYAMVDPRIRYD